MALQLTVDQIDSVPEALRGEYTERGGKFHLNIVGLGNWPKEKADLEAELLATRASERSAIGDRLMDLLSTGAGKPEGLDLLTERLDQRIRIETVDGKRVMSILSVDGTTPMVGNGKNGLATLGDLAKEARRTWPSMFDGAGGPSPDPSATRRDSGGKTIARAEWEAMNPFEHAAKIKDGFRPVDHAVAREKSPNRGVGKTIGRKEFDALNHFDRAAIIKEGVRPVDQSAA
jgi:hypothetical protein